MAQLIFTFTLNTDTKETAFVGSMKPQMAFQMLQQLIVAEAVKNATKDIEPKIESNKEVKKDEPN